MKYARERLDSTLNSSPQITKLASSQDHTHLPRFAFQAVFGTQNYAKKNTHEPLTRLNVGAPVG